MFWRTCGGDEIDVIEKSGKEIRAYECKWKGPVVAPKSFRVAYPDARFEYITPENIVADFLKHTK